MIYVDQMQARAPTPRWPWPESCHLFSDCDLDELHKFAEVIGLKATWFQEQGRVPHYDLTKSKREVALARGATVCTPEIFRRSAIYYATFSRGTS